MWLQQLKKKRNIVNVDLILWLDSVAQKVQKERQKEIQKIASTRYKMYFINMFIDIFYKYVDKCVCLREQIPADTNSSFINDFCCIFFFVSLFLIFIV